MAEETATVGSLRVEKDEAGDRERPFLPLALVQDPEGRRYPVRKIDLAGPAINPVQGPAISQEDTLILLEGKSADGYTAHYHMSGGAFWRLLFPDTQPGEAVAGILLAQAMSAALWMQRVLDLDDDDDDEGSEGGRL